MALLIPAQLTPVWYVKTDTGAYQMDPRTGQVSRTGGEAVPTNDAGKGPI